MHKEKLLFVIFFILILGCTATEPKFDINAPDSTSPASTTILLESALPTPSGQPDLTVFTEAEMYQFDLMRADWTKEQMEAEGMEPEVNEPGGLTTYSNGDLSYIYFDEYNTLTPAVVNVYGDVPGPRGIQVGDSFEEVMALFPQDKDWKSNPIGEFYGDIYDVDDPLAYSLSGHVSEHVGGKDITLVVEGGSSFLRIFFEDDILTHYTFYLIADH